MSDLLHKEITIIDNTKKKQLPSISIYGNLMGWTDGDIVINCNKVVKFIEEEWIKGGLDAILILMKGVVGSCIIEIIRDDETFLFASCSSGGFYYTKIPNKDDHKVSYLVSNNEGKFFRQALKLGGKITEGALLNAILSHQSVIRSSFNGLVDQSKRCPPGFYVKFSKDKFFLHSYLINSQVKTRKQQDFTVKKRFEAISKVYESYCSIKGSIARLSYSGGVDSTALLLNNKAVLDKSLQGHYINRGNISEFKLAVSIAKRAGCKIDFIEPFENFSYEDVRKRSSIGLSMLNGIHYMKHGFQSYPYNLKNINKEQELILLSGQNSDTMFHIDTHAPGSFTVGIIRLIKMASGIFKRFCTTNIYYRFFRIVKNKNDILHPSIIKFYTSLYEHQVQNNDIPLEIDKIIKNYRIKYYFNPFKNWVQKEFYLNPDIKKLSNEEKDNRLARLARWLRTVSNFHQQYRNISYFENTKICTPFSEGPMASELLSYRLGLIDILIPKLFLHNFIKKKLGISYSEVRQIVLGGGLIDLPKQLLYIFRKLIDKTFKKFFKIKNKNSIKENKVFDKKDLYYLREILGHNNGIIERVLLDYVEDNSCRQYLNLLYDYLELKIDINYSDKTEGMLKTEAMRLCRLVNLQIMLLAKD